MQTRDDAEPELAETFSLEITSATGGATINPDGRMAKIVVVASDFPHGLFEFGQPTEVTVAESDREVGVIYCSFVSVGNNNNLFIYIAPYNPIDVIVQLRFTNNKIKIKVNVKTKKLNYKYIHSLLRPVLWVANKNIYYIYI